MLVFFLVLRFMFLIGEFKHEVRQFQKPYDNQQGLCCTNLLKADFTKSYQIQGTTWV